MKTCTRCGENKDLSKFYDVKRRGLVFKTAECKTCKLSYSREYQRKNQEKMRQKQDRWFQKNKQKQYDRVRTFKSLNPDKVKERDNKPHVKIVKRLRTRLWHAVVRKTGSVTDDLGCSIDQLLLYLESKFQPGMTWDNYGCNGWHIDHIVPLASFDLTNPIEFKQACHYTNLQPLWAKDNLIKGYKLGTSYEQPR